MRLTVQIEGINLEKLLRSAQEAGIVLSGVRRTGTGSVQLSVSALKRRQLAALCERSGWKLEEKRADGLLRAVRFLKKRPALLPALAMSILIVALSSERILAVRIEHAQENIAEVRRFLEEEGVYPGRRKADFSLDDLRQRLSLRAPALSFASFRYAGSTLIADCRVAVQGERRKVPGGELDIVASQPGIVTRISAVCGTPQVKAGQAVRKGQVLIRGEERTQQGGMRSIQADGEVYARVFSGGQARVRMEEMRTVETGQTRTRVTLKTPWHARVTQMASPFESCDESSEDQFIVGLYLPLWREKKTYAQTLVHAVPRNRGDAASMAQGAAEEIAKKQCPYGALILDKWVDYSMIDNEYLYAEVVLEYETSIAGRLR